MDWIECERNREIKLGLKNYKNVVLINRHGKTSCGLAFR